MKNSNFFSKIISGFIYSLMPWIYLYLVELPLYKWFWFFGLFHLGVFTYLIPLLTYIIIAIPGWIISILIYPIYLGFMRLIGRKAMCMANWNFAFNLTIVLFFILTNRISLGFKSSGALSGAWWFHIVAGLIATLIIIGAIFLAIRKKLTEESSAPRFKLSGIIFLGIVFLLLSIAYNSPRILSGERSLKDKPNVLIITLDTSNINYFPGYGSPDFVAPNISELEKDSVLFENAYCSVPLTTPSHASIFSGAHPQYHKAYTNESKVPMRIRMASEFFKSKGYLTAGFPSALCVTSVNGFDQGCDYFVNRHHQDDYYSNIIRQLAPFRFIGQVLGFDHVRADIPENANADLINGKFLKWLRKNKDRRFYAWLHYFDLHAPYLPPDMANSTRAAQLSDFKVTHEPASISALQCLFGERYFSDLGINPKELTDEEITFIRNLYRGELSHLDKALGKVIENLKDYGIYENTIIAVIGDHGEGLYERGYFGHNYFLNEDEIRIPMLLRIPGTESKKVSWVVESIDLLPTLIDYAGFEVPSRFSLDSKSQMFGRSLRGLIEEDPEIVPYWKKTALSQIFIYSRSIREGDWKLVWGLNKGERVFRYNCDEFHLYDIKNDPNESTNLAGTYPEEVGDLTGRLEDLMRELEGKKNFRTIPFGEYINADKSEDDQKLIDTLIGLGYLSGAQIEKMLSSEWTYDDSAEKEITGEDEKCGCRGREPYDVSIEPWELPNTTTEGV